MLLASASVALPQTPPSATTVEEVRQELEHLRTEFETLRQQYDQRFQALEQRLAELYVAGPAQPGAPPSGAPPVPAAPTQGAGAAAGPPGSPPDIVAQAPAAPPQTTPAGGPATPQAIAPASLGSRIFNPDIAVIGDVLGAAGHNSVVDQPSLELHEAEASFQAVVDPYARADFFFSFGEEGVDVEEGYITFTTLPGALLLKAGKLRAAFGKVNQMHTHALPWTDRPLVTDNLVGGDEGISDAGLSVSRLILNPWFFLEATGEVYRGNDEVFQTPSRSQLTYVGRLRGYRDLTEGTNLDVGTSIAYGPTGLTSDSSARLIGVDATFRYRPLRRAIYRRLIARTELVWSRQDLDPGRQNALGYYISGDYQFARRWYAGARFDESDRALDASLHDTGGSFVLTFWPSEFSQIRGQYRRTRYAEDVTANELLFQFLFSIGAHGAHVF
jgi:hypothetical protein